MCELVSSNNKISWNWFIVIQTPCGVDRLHIENTTVTPAAAPTTDWVTTDAFWDVEDSMVVEIVEFADVLFVEDVSILFHTSLFVVVLTLTWNPLSQTTQELGLSNFHVVQFCTFQSSICIFIEFISRLNNN